MNIIAYAAHRRRLLAATGAIAVLGAAMPAQATPPATPNNDYVSPAGSDSAAGTKDAPFQTLARAAAAATRAGTTVWVAPGTYAGSIQKTASGTASSRIYYPVHLFQLVGHSQEQCGLPDRLGRKPPVARCARRATGMASRSRALPAAPTPI